MKKILSNIPVCFLFVLMACNTPTALVSPDEEIFNQGQSDLSGSQVEGSVSGVSLTGSSSVCGGSGMTGSGSSSTPSSGTTGFGSSSALSSGSSSTPSSGTTASGATASGTTASGTTASGTTASGTTASGTTASGTTASGTTASSEIDGHSNNTGPSVLLTGNVGEQKGGGAVDPIQALQAEFVRYVSGHLDDVKDLNSEYVQGLLGKDKFGDLFPWMPEEVQRIHEDLRKKLLEAKQGEAKKVIENKLLKVEKLQCFLQGLNPSPSGGI